MKKRIISLTLAFCMILSMMPIAVSAADVLASGACGDDLTWTLTDDGILRIMGQRAMWDYIYYWDKEEEIIKEDAETEGAVPWINYCASIRKVELSEGITHIGKTAFMNCQSLEQVQIPEGVVTIGTQAFQGCTALRQIHFPESVTDLSNSLLGCDALERIIFDGDAPEQQYDTLYRAEGGIDIMYHSSREGWEEAMDEWRLPPLSRWHDLDGMIEPGTFAFDQDVYVVEVGENLKLAHNADPAVAAMLNWSIDGEEFAAFSSDETLVGRSPGSVTVTACTDDGRYADTCTVTVIEPVIPDSGIYSLSGKSKNNAGANNYTNNLRWDAVNSSYLYQNDSGNLERVQYISGTGVVVCRYSSSLSLMEEIVIKPEMSIFGGFFAGETYNFLVYGQNNPNESDSVEVYRIVKYSKDWDRLDACSIRGADTKIPFRAGTSDMAEKDGMLYLHTSRKKYISDDGLNHQKNTTFVLDQETMTVTESLMDYNSCSHSFSQRVRANDHFVFYVDHGDAIYRAIVITQHVPGAYTSVGTPFASKELLLEIPGELGDNDTGVSLGGFELSSNNCLVVGNSVDLSDAASYSTSGQRNIWLCVADQKTLESETIWLTNYTSGAGVEVYNPHLVKVSDDIFMILWEQDAGSIRTHILLVDGNGKKLCSPLVTDLRLSDCQPICTEEDLVTWFVTERGRTTLYQVSWKQLLWARSDAEKILGHYECPFYDVKKSDYFYNPVLWAVEEGITTGISAYRFGPGTACTRGQVVTFLWRAAGEPEPTSTKNPFKDVKESAFYYDAVLWAVEQGITTGTGATTFSPNSPCTRGQVVTFLHRAAGTPEPESAKNPFSDVKSSGFYYDAVLWAVEEGITTGTTATKFGPNQTCTRAQVVTFLYRAFAK